MPQLRLIGWRPGLNKVGLTRVLQSELGLSLSQAKRATDQVLQGEAVSLPVSDRQTADRAAQRVTALGADALVEADQIAPNLAG